MAVSDGSTLSSARMVSRAVCHAVTIAAASGSLARRCAISAARSGGSSPAANAIRSSYDSRVIREVSLQRIEHRGGFPDTSNFETGKLGHRPGGQLALESQLGQSVL